MRILIINGPNLNLLGQRENNIYGNNGLQQIEEETRLNLEKFGTNLEKLEWFQSNSEGGIIGKIQDDLILNNHFDALIINPAGFTHTSVAILDTLLALKVPVIEIHLSQIFRRDEFRKNNLVTTSAANEVILGGQENVYTLAIISLVLKGKGQN